MIFFGIAMAFIFALAVIAAWGIYEISSDRFTP